MGRSTRAAAERHHQQLVDAAARLVRERDLAAVSLPEVMGAVGLKRGGFYKHFESKDALLAAAVERAFVEHSERLEGFARTQDDDPTATREAFIDFCLSEAHRDDPGTGCPSSLLIGVSRLDAGSPPRTAFVDQFSEFLDLLIKRTRAPGADAAAQREQTLRELSAIVGAVLIARAMSGHPISEEVLAAVSGYLHGGPADAPSASAAC
jgi:TetR/AcrR family transcriptional repressor of nem operon